MKKQPEVTAMTRKRLIDTFWEIAQQKGIDKVTVSEITKKAHLNRSTFYEYFSDINHLLEEAEDEIIINLTENALNTFTSDEPVELRVLCHQLIETFIGYDNKLFLLLGKQGDPLFLSKIRIKLNTLLLPTIKIPDFVPYAEYIIAYRTSATAGLLSYWHETGRRITLEELGDVLYDITCKGLLGMTKINTL